MRACAGPVWQTRKILEIFRYAKETRAAGERPLHIVGFDSQAAPRLDRPLWLGAALEPFDPTIAGRVRAADSAFLAAYRVGRGPAYADSAGAELIHIYTAAAAGVTVATESTGSGPAFLIRVLRSARAHVQQLAARAAGRGSSETRDVAMAENIAFLAGGMYPGAKIVTWGHNSHLRHDNASVRRLDTGEHLPATTGTLLRDEFADETYTIGMYTGSGRLGVVTRRVFDVAEPSPRHGETLLMPAGPVSLARLGFVITNRHSDATVFGITVSNEVEKEAEPPRRESHAVHHHSSPVELRGPARQRGRSLCTGFSHPGATAYRQPRGRGSTSVAST